MGAKIAEQMKIRHYCDVYNAASGYPAFPSRFVPFVLETTGAFGPKAWALIEKLAGLREVIALPNERLAAARKVFLERVSTICAMAKHRSVLFHRRYTVYPAQPGPVQPPRAMDELLNLPLPEIDGPLRLEMHPQVASQ
jgi:hypothetical protein